MSCCPACATKRVLLLGQLVLSLQGCPTFEGVSFFWGGILLWGGVYNKAWRAHLRTHDLTEAIDLLTHPG